MKNKSTNPKMAMMMGRAKKRPELAFRPEAPVMPRSAAPAMPDVNPMAAMAAAPAMPAMKKGGMAKKCMKEGGMADMAQDKKIIKKAFTMHDSQEHKGEHTNLTKLKRGGMMKKMAKGGMSKFEKSGKDVEKKGMKEGSKADMAMDKQQMMGMKKGGTAKGCGYSKGGQLAKANGIAVRGKTKGKIC